jgi:hypothetical protein
MDLKDLTPKSDLVEVELAHPSNGDPLFNEDNTRMSITVYAPYSKQYKQALYNYTKGKIKNGQADLDVIELEELNVSVLAATTESWNITFDGKNPELTEELAREIYTDAFWIKTQIDEAVSQVLNFTKA